MKPINLREADFKREIEVFSFPESVKEEFFLYWSEPNKSNTKMKFEMEKTWHLGRRIARWANNGFASINGQGNKAITQTKKEPPKAPTNDFERLDAFMSEYFKRPADAKFEAFGAWYEFMKENKLLKVFTRGEVFQLREIYGQDNLKCRCAAVQMSLDAYRNTGLKIMDLIKMRESLDSR